jgi:hypothetical protein
LEKKAPLSRLQVVEGSNSDVVNRFSAFLEFNQGNYVRYDDIPEYLLCRITDELMRDTVNLSSGFSNEWSAILKHFVMNGNFVPLTREEVSKTVTDSHNLKQVSEDFFKRCPLAFEYIAG